MRTDKVIGLIVLTVLATVLVVTLNGRESSAQAQAPGTPVKIAVVDTHRLFTEYERVKDANMTLNQRQDEIEAQIKQKREAIEVLTAEMQNFKFGTQDYYDRQKEVLKLSVELESYGRLSREQIKREMRMTMADVYNEITQAIEKAGNDMGYDLVLCRDTADLQGDEELRVLMEKIRQHKVIFARDSLDITDIVLQNVNQSYRLEQAGGR